MACVGFLRSPSLGAVVAFFGLGKDWRRYSRDANSSVKSCHESGKLRYPLTGGEGGTVIDFQRANALATLYIRQFERECGVPLVIDDGLTFTFDEGWIFRWGSEAQIKYGDHSDALAGNAPLVIFRDGTVHCAPTSYSDPKSILGWIVEHPQQSVVTLKI